MMIDVEGSCSCSTASELGGVISLEGKLHPPFVLRGYCVVWLRHNRLIVVVLVLADIVALGGLSLSVVLYGI
jgi:hypothetical protein